MMINAQAERKETLVLDLAGGDKTFPRFAKELDLVALLISVGIVPVAMYVLGPDVDNLVNLRDIEQENAFCP
jgi:hypothetical protein